MLFNLRIGPLSVIFKRHGRHELEIQAGSTNQTVHGDLISSLLDFWKKFLHDLCNRLQRFRRCLVPFVLAPPFTADTIEAHGTIGQGDIRQGSVGARVLKCNRCKGLRDIIKNEKGKWWLVGWSTFLLRASGTLFVLHGVNKRTEAEANAAMRKETDFIF